MEHNQIIEDFLQEAKYISFHSLESLAENRSAHVIECVVAVNLFSFNLFAVEI